MQEGMRRLAMPERLVLAILFASICSATAQTRPRPAKVSSVAELLTLAADPRTNFDYMQVSIFLDSLPANERRKVEHQLIELPHEELISGIITHVGKARDIDAADLIASRASGWKTTTQARAIGISAIARGPFLAIPRALLRDALNGAKVSASADLRTDSLGKAALVLARSGSQTDMQLIQSAARLQPKSWGVWMAVAYADALNASLAAAADGLYRDTTLALPIRVAAATALEPVNANAAAFVIGEMRSYFSRFSGVDIIALQREMLKATRPGTADPAPAVLQYASHERDRFLLSSLLVLKSDSVRQLVLQNLTARNMSIRLICGFVAARRWPADLLKAGQGLFTNKEYTGLAAIIAVYRPEHAAAASAAVRQNELTAAKSKLVASGTGVLFLDLGGILDYF